jgi:hypothetical protein
MRSHNKLPALLNTHEPTATNNTVKWMLLMLDPWGAPDSKWHSSVALLAATPLLHSCQPYSHAEKTASWTDSIA